jgi:hypothetical protein
MATRERYSPWQNARILTRKEGYPARYAQPVTRPGS